MERRLVFVSVGDRPLLHESLRSSESFDLWVYFYGEDSSIANDFVNRSSVFERRHGGKWPNLLAAYESNLLAFQEFDAILVLDDDLSLTEQQITRLFDWRQDRNLWVLSPTFKLNGQVSFSVNRSHAVSAARYVSFVENNAPLFSREKLERFLIDFDGSLHGWGVDWWYMNLFGMESKNRYAAIDEISCTNPFARGGMKEIDRLAPPVQLRSAWERVREARGFVEQRPITYSVLQYRSPLSVVRALAELLAAGVIALNTPGRVRGQTLKLLRESLTGLYQRQRKGRFGFERGCAGINRQGVGDGRALRRRGSVPRWPRVMRWRP